MSEVVAVYGRTEEVAAFVASVPPFIQSRGWGNIQAVGFALGGQLIAGVVYQNWSPEAGVIELSAAATDSRWLTRKSLLAIFGFPFDELGCQMAVLRIGEHNERMRSIARRVGFVETIIPRLRGRDEAEIIACLTVEDWRRSRVNTSGQAV